MRHVADQIDDPSICIVRMSNGARIPAELARLLEPVAPQTLHVYRLEANRDVKLHYHDYDEYWGFVSGRPRVTLRSPSGVTCEFDLEPGDLAAAVRGIEHTLWADHELVYFQYSSALEGDERSGHLTR